jgi:CRP/FNR family transcriptional regulator, cyclic AMP receptor protein
MDDVGGNSLFTLDVHPRVVSLSVQQRAEMLDETRWSAEFVWREIEVIARHVTAHTASRGTTIFAEGDPSRYLGLVIKGQVDILKRDSSGRKHVITTLGPGKTLGEMALIDREPRSAAAVATDDTLLLLLTEEQFEQLTKSYPGLGIRLILKLAKMMSQRLRRTSGVLVDYLED